MYDPDMHAGQLIASLVVAACLAACSTPSTTSAAAHDAPTGDTTSGEAHAAAASKGASTAATPGMWMSPAGESSSGSGNTDAPQRALRVITWNIHHGEGTDGKIDLDRIAAWLRSMNPDVVFLQEVDRLTKRSGNVDQAAVIAAKLGMWSGFGAFMPFEGGEYGMAILSRAQVSDVRNIALPPGKHEPRTLLAATIHPFGGPPIRLFDVHLDWLEDDGNRYAQAQALLREVSGDVARMGGAPAIIAGDFNDQPGSRTVSLMQGQFTEADKTGASNTWPNHDPAQEIDFIFVIPANRLVAQPAESLDAGVASDHRPVMTTVLVW